jgi:hypothetical protein
VIVVRGRDASCWPLLSALFPSSPRLPACQVHRKILRVTSHYEGLRLRPGTEEEKESSKQKLAALRANDQLKREKADARNSLEAYLYEVGTEGGKPGSQVVGGEEDEDVSRVMLSVSHSLSFVFFFPLSPFAVSLLAGQEQDDGARGGKRRKERDVGKKADGEAPFSLSDFVDAELPFPFPPPPACCFIRSSPWSQPMSNAARSWPKWRPPTTGCMTKVSVSVLCLALPSPSLFSPRNRLPLGLPRLPNGARRPFPPAPGPPAPPPPPSFPTGRDVEASVYKERTTQVRALAVPIFLRQAEGPGGARAAALEAAVKNVAEVGVS